MRTHGRYQPLYLWRDLARLQSLMQAKNLIAARLEPVVQQRLDGATLDLIFMVGRSVAVVPLIDVDVVQFLEQEKDPLIWPGMVPQAVSDDVTAAIAGRILPWLRAQMRARLQNDELIRIYGDAEQGAFFEVARRNGYMGATTTAKTVATIAPYSYAARFARGKRVLIAAGDGATGGAAILRFAAHVCVVRECLADPESAHAWYAHDSTPLARVDGKFDLVIGDRAGLELVSAQARGATRVALDEVPTEGTWLEVPVIKPVPTDLLIAYDRDDGPAVRTFAINVGARATERSTEPPACSPPLGGSAGRILLVLRSDWKSCPDADTEEGLELARRLRSEGIEVDVGIEPGQLVADRYDLLHLFGLSTPDLAGRFLDLAKRRNVATAITAGLDDIPAQLWWGTLVGPITYKVGEDEVTGAALRFKFEQRKLEADMHTPNSRYFPYEHYERDLRVALEAADTVFVSGASEEALIAVQHGRSGPIVQCAPFVAALAPCEPVDELVGTEDFILAHAPIAGRCNQLYLARAAMAADLPLVICGTVTEVDYLDLLREFTDERVIILSGLRPGQIASLYRRARVFADVGWISLGPSRVAQAAMAGSALVVASHHYAASLWRGDGLWTADPASERSIILALREAWHQFGQPSGLVEKAERRIRSACDQDQSLRTLVGAYAAVSAKSTVAP